MSEREKGKGVKKDGMRGRGGFEEEIKRGDED